MASDRNQQHEWGNTEEDILKLMRDKPEGFKKQLKEKISSLSNVNQFHNWRDADFNLLFHASMEDCKEAVKYLLEKGADPTRVNHRGTNVLHLMAKKGQHDMADKCHSKVPMGKRLRFVNVATEPGWTPLMAAAENNQEGFVKWLLSKGASVNFTMKTGWTAMHAAAKNNHRGVLKLLLEKGGDKDIEAAHRDFGRNLKVEDVTAEEETIKLLKQY